MLKPNIRGVAKRNLRVALAGWRNLQDNSLIKHRYPWRLSWVEQMASDSSLSPALARSGQVFLVRSAPASQTKSVPGSSQPRSKYFFWFALISAIGVLAGVMFVPTAAAKKTAGTAPSKLPVVAVCKSFLINPEQEITKWLDGTGSNEIAIKEIQRQELGGVQLRRISATCNDQQADFQITLSLRDKTWRLKKFTRLAN
jgi:hypothetical protein